MTVAAVILAAQRSLRAHAASRACPASAGWPTSPGPAARCRSSSSPAIPTEKIARALAGAPVTLAEPAPAGRADRSARSSAASTSRSAEIDDTDAALIWPARMVWVGPGDGHLAHRGARPVPGRDAPPDVRGEARLAGPPAGRHLETLRGARRRPDAGRPPRRTSQAGRRRRPARSTWATRARRFDARTTRAELPAYVGPRRPAAGTPTNGAPPRPRRRRTRRSRTRRARRWAATRAEPRPRSTVRRSAPDRSGGRGSAVGRGQDGSGAPSATDGLDRRAAARTTPPRMSATPASWRPDGASAEEQRAEDERRDRLGEQEHGREDRRQARQREVDEAVAGDLRDERERDEPAVGREASGTTSRSPTTRPARPRPRRRSRPTRRTASRTGAGRRGCPAG